MLRRTLSFYWTQRWASSIIVPREVVYKTSRVGMGHRARVYSTGAERMVVPKLLIEHKHRLSAENRPRSVSRGALPGSPQTRCPEQSQTPHQTLRESVDSRSTHISLGTYAGECRFSVASDCVSRDLHVARAREPASGWFLVMLERCRRARRAASGRAGYL